MSQHRTIIAEGLPKKITNGKVANDLDRADRIIKKLQNEGYYIISPEISAVLKNAINMLVSADKIDPADRRRIAESAISTVWGGFLPIKGADK